MAGQKSHLNLWTIPKVKLIGPGTHAVEVLIDGLHESRSEPRVMLKVLPVPWLLTWGGAKFFFWGGRSLNYSYWRDQTMQMFNEWF